MGQKLIKHAIKFKNSWKEPEIIEIPDIKISIVVPVYYPEHLDEVLVHLCNIGGYQEIILVDDTGNFKEQQYRYLKWRNKVTVVYHSKNMGRSAARNTGASYASGDILIFMDQDMFLAPNFITTVKKYYANNSLLFLGLRETIPFDEVPINGEWCTPDKRKDWRIQTKVLPEFVDLTVMNVGSAYNGCKPFETIYIADVTNGLREMGIATDTTLGFWDLPSMVVSHSMAIEKNVFYEIGGFPEWIQGWGGEDIVLGFLACARHIPIYLSECISYQAYHHPFSGSEKAKNIELMRNINYYRKWANSIEDFPEYHINSIKKRGHVED